MKNDYLVITIDFNGEILNERRFSTLESVEKHIEEEFKEYLIDMAFEASEDMSMEELISIIEEDGHAAFHGCSAYVHYGDEQYTWRMIDLKGLEIEK